ncbi:DNA-binding transcription factor [Lithospermum erythrorhizon]|uniref:DNA-binding transcription factor n=1 Tax=Lithospermum erythrorhizon TaxID=34254 RepID=A0AAV3PES2_LITER
MDGNAIVEVKDYLLLKDLKVVLSDVEEENGNWGFILCFWLYLSNNSAVLPATILQQGNSDTESSTPLLLLNEDKKMVLLPVHLIHEEALKHDSPSRWSNVPSTSTPFEIPSKKWVHVGCEVSLDFVRLYLDGDVVGEKSLTSTFNKDLHSSNFKTIVLPVISGGDCGLQDYVHNVEVLPLTTHLKDQYDKKPPLQLCMNNSSASEVEEDDDGVWSIVGGKASCRRIFSLDVILMDAFQQPVQKDIEVFASLVYADTGILVEKTIDEDAPLLASYDGIEVDSSDRPSQLINGRASFKLKIAQLSSKSHNRLFRIRFDIPCMGYYPFLMEFSPPIRCISRTRNPRTSVITWKRSPSKTLNSLGSNDGALGNIPSIVHEARPSPLSKRVKLENEKTSNCDATLKQADVGSYSCPWPNAENNNAKESKLEGRPETHDTGESSLDSENSEVTNSVLRSIPDNRSLVADLIVFKYCLGGLTERSRLLKEMSISAHEDDILKFAEQVSLFSGCAHHRHQITMSKRLIEEEIKAWNLISQNNQHVLWENLVAGINEQFIDIAVSSSRPLTHQDFDFFRRLAGCQDLVSQANFEKLWRWLYPVALTLSQDCINSTWKSVTPKWIEGFITKEEAEAFLQCPGGLQDPGTFILRFPASRSWPHPDAGNLVVTYVGRDYTIHHRLLSRDLIYSSHDNKVMRKPLHELLNEVPELSRLGSTEYILGLMAHMFRSSFKTFTI